MKIVTHSLHTFAIAGGLNMGTEKHTILGGKVYVYKREKSPYWQCSTFLNERNRRISTKQESLNLTKEFAEDWNLTLRGKNARGELANEKTFDLAGAQFLQEFEADTMGERNPKCLTNHKAHLRLLPFFAKLGLSEISTTKIQEYRISRIQSQNRGNPTCCDRPKAVVGGKDV